MLFVGARLWRAEIGVPIHKNETALKEPAQRMKSSYDVAVIGVGTMGSFACCDLARRGLRVIGFDQFAPPHGRGSHSGDTRIFRIAYTENPDYVPLALRASELWDRYAELSQTRLLTRCGMLSVGSQGGDFIQGILNSARVHGLDATQYTRDEVQSIFPAFALEEEQVGVFEQKAGWIDANAAIETSLRLAERFGATLQLNTPVLQWSRNQDHFDVVTPYGTAAVEKLIITAGAWSSRLLEQLGLPLRVERKVLTWVDPIEPALFRSELFPVFGLDENFLYGFPAHGDKGVKLAVHWKRGQTVLDPEKPIPDPNADDAIEALAIATKLFPKLAGPLPQALHRVREMKTCLYVMSHDEHFFVDRHPEWPDLIFAAGFSGHGFKFAPAIGEIVADLATSGLTNLPIGFLSTKRLASR